MAFASSSAQRQPLSEINMTPLIDVMLVLLVMFIITIPLQTHAVKLDLPQDCPSCPRVDTLKNKIVVANGGAILWNGSPITHDELAYNLAASARMDPQPGKCCVAFSVRAGPERPEGRADLRG